MSSSDYNESIYIKNGIKDGFLRHHAIEALIVSGKFIITWYHIIGIVMNEMEANEAWNRLLDEDCLKQGIVKFILFFIS